VEWNWSEAVKRLKEMMDALTGVEPEPENTEPVQDESVWTRKKFFEEPAMGEPKKKTTQKKPKQSQAKTTNFVRDVRLFISVKVITKHESYVLMTDLFDAWEKWRWCPEQKRFIGATNSASFARALHSLGWESKQRGPRGDSHRYWYGMELRGE